MLVYLWNLVLVWRAATHSTKVNMLSRLVVPISHSLKTVLLCESMPCTYLWKTQIDIKCVTGWMPGGKTQMLTYSFDGFLMKFAGLCMLFVLTAMLCKTGHKTVVLVWSVIPGFVSKSGRFVIHRFQRLRVNVQQVYHVCVQVR